MMWKPLVVTLVVALSVAGVARSAPKEGDSFRTTDRLQIEELLNRYTWALDGEDSAGVTSLFLEDAAIGGPMGDIKGRDAISKFFDTLVARVESFQPPTKIVHILSNIVIDFTGPDTATAKAVWTEVWKPGGIAMGIRNAGDYHDQLVRKDGHWFFARREIGGPFIPNQPPPGR